MTALSCKACHLLNTRQFCSLKHGPVEERYWHPRELVRKAESEMHRIRIYVFHKSPWLISMHDEGPFSSQTIPRAWVSVISAPTPQINNWGAFETSVDSSRAKENHSNHLSCFFNWRSMLLPMPSALPATVVTKRLIVLKKFIFSGHISLAATNKQDLINLLSVNSFPWLVNKRVPQNLTLIAVSSSGTFCVIEFCQMRNSL